MKKLLAILLTAAMIFAVTACGEGEPASNGNSGDNTTAGDNTTSGGNNTQTEGATTDDLTQEEIDELIHEARGDAMRVFNALSRAVLDADVVATLLSIDVNRVTY